MPVLRLLRFFRHLPDRLLHPIRRRRLRRQMEARESRPEEILFVCHGNICRSPYAQVAFGKMIPAESGYEPALQSAGFVGPGRPSPDAGIRVARERGIDLTAHRSRLITVAGVRRSEVIVVMNPEQRRQISTLYGAAARKATVVVLGDLDPVRPTRRGIRDPFRGEEEAFADSYARIDRCLHELVSAWGILEAGASTSTPAGRMEEARDGSPPSPLRERNRGRPDTPVPQTSRMASGAKR